jgi:RNA polymerase sigma factor for flagellar operon FliA
MIEPTSSNVAPDPGVDARQALVTQFLPLVRYVVGQLPHRLGGLLDRDDFHSIGVVGLLHAAAHFDPARGASFKTFAYTAIRGAILDEVRRLDPVPRRRRERLRAMERQQQDWRGRLDHEPSLAELAAALGCAEAELAVDLQVLAASRTLSLDEARSADGVPGLELADDLATDPADAAELHESLQRVADAIDDLPATDRSVMVEHFLEHRFLRDIADDLGVTDSRVSQILTRAIARLRRRLEAPEPQ